MGRPSSFTDEIGEGILDALLEGKSLRQICEDEGMPNRSTVLRWIAADADFAAKYARAREMQADYMDDLILETANGCTGESYQADKVKIAAYQWRASKLKPKAYGDKVQHTGPDGEGPVQVALTPSQARAKLLSHLGRLSTPQE